jgi:hypothetical protein
MAPRRKRPELTDVATHDEVMRILTAQARDGSVTAAGALERALRGARREDEDFDAELERLAGRRNDPD